MHSLEPVHPIPLALPPGAGSRMGGNGGIWRDAKKEPFLGDVSVCGLSFARGLPEPSHSRLHSSGRPRLEGGPGSSAIGPVPGRSGAFLERRGLCGVSVAGEKIRVERQGPRGPASEGGQTDRERGSGGGWAGPGGRGLGQWSAETGVQVRHTVQPLAAVSAFGWAGFLHTPALREREWSRSMAGPNRCCLARSRDGRRDSGAQPLWREVGQARTHI